METHPAPMPTIPKSPLRVTISEVTVTLGGTTRTVQLAPQILGYLGDELFVRATITGQTVEIEIHPTRLPQSHPPGPAPVAVTAIALTVTYKGAASQQTFPLATRYGGAPLAVTMKLSHDLQFGSLFVTESAPQNEPTDKDSFLSFVLVQELPGPGEDPAQKPYRLNWVGPVDVEDYLRFTSATVVLPDPKGGGVTGPMGLELP